MAEVYPNDEIRKSAEKACTYTHARECRKCGGRGEICGRFSLGECYTCDGTGEITEQRIDGRKLAGLRRRVAYRIRLGIEEIHAWTHCIACTGIPEGTVTSKDDIIAVNIIVKPYRVSR